jgi:predicted secreted protein
LNISGVADDRTGVVDPATGLNVVGSERLLEVALSANSCGKFKMMNTSTNGFIEGVFNITTFSKTGDTPGLLNFDATLQSRSDVVVQGAV